MTTDIMIFTDNGSCYIALLAAREMIQQQSQHKEYH